MREKNYSITKGSLVWWYSDAAGLLAKHQSLLLLTLADFFSFKILFKTLFQPWKRDVISDDNLSLQARFQVWGLNLVTRLIGLVVRSGAILLGVVVIVLLLIGYLILWVGWILGPLAPIILAIIGFYTLLEGLS